MEQGTQAFSLSYHSGALAFSFILSLIPMVLFFSTLIKLLPIAHVNLISRELENIFPGVTRKILISFLSSIRVEDYGFRYGYSLVSLALTLIFTANFFRNLERALSLVTLKRDEPNSLVSKTVAKYRIGKFRLSNISHLFATLLLSLIFILSLASLILFDILSSKLLGNIELGFLKEITLQTLLIGVNLVGIYKFLTPVKVKFLNTLKVSFTIALVLILLKYVFNLYAFYWLKHGPAYGIFAYFLLFLIWLNITFGLILFGGKLLVANR